jgi:phenylpyruvate tautomerase PptA (4-oxalocrotonate tautomerase family)
MPIVEIEIVLTNDEFLPDGLAQRIADTLGRIFNSSPGNTWVRLRELPLNHYAENGGPLAAEVKPVFVSVLKAYLLPLAERKEEARRIAVEVAEACGRLVENVHVLYLPEGVGQVAFGGTLKSQ